MRSRIWAGLLAAACLTTAGAHAAPPSNSPIYLPLDENVVPASLTAAPRNEDLEREYPRIPLMMGLGGMASMTCKTFATGLLGDCHVVSEEPVGMGFGAATVRTAAYFRVRPAMMEGRPVEGSITIPLQWKTQERSVQPEVQLPPATPAALRLGRRIVQLEDASGRMQAVWSSTLEQQTAQLAETDDAQAGAGVIDAFRQGLADAIGAEVERQAHELAARESETDLEATVVFLESHAGQAWTSAQAKMQADAPKDFYERIAVAARAHLCQGDCAGNAAKIDRAARGR